MEFLEVAPKPFKVQHSHTDYEFLGGKISSINLVDGCWVNGLSRDGVDGLTDIVVGRAITLHLQQLARTVAQKLVKSNLQKHFLN